MRTAVIVKYEIYIEGYPTEVGSACYFYCGYALFKSNELGRMDSKLVYEIYKDHSGDCTIPYAKMLQAKFLKLLHSLFRYSSCTHGCDASIPVIISSMNDKSKSSYPQCPIRGKLHLTQFTFDAFFKDNKGVVKENGTKPRLSEEQKGKRVTFAEENDKETRLKKSRKKNEEGKFYYCFIDEKWFYIFTKQKKRKYLPPAPFKNPDDLFESASKICSHHKHAMKVLTA